MTKPGVPEVSAFLRDHISRRTRVPAESITGSTVLVDIGLQSVDAVLICGEIEDHFGIEVEPSLIFEFGTLDEVIGAVCELLADA